jgi:hypothetical protein
MKLKRAQSGTLNLGYRAGLLAIAFLAFGGTACIAQTSSTDDSAESQEGRALEENTENAGASARTDGLYFTSNSSSSTGSGKGPGTTGGPPVQPVPSPWEPNPGDPNGNGPGTVDAPVPSPWMNPNPGQATSTETSATSADSPSKSHTQ